MRHVSGADPWPCLAFVDGAAPDAAAWGWVGAGAPELHENRLAAAAPER